MTNTQSAGQARFDAIITGAGPVGLALALALAENGASVALIDRGSEETLSSTAFDGRISALSASSVAMLTALGLGETLSAHGCAIAGISVRDRPGTAPLRFDPPKGESDMGVMLANSLLRSALFARVADIAGISRFMDETIAAIHRDSDGARIDLASGPALHAPLLIAADGRASPLRNGARIPLAHWRYDQQAMTFLVRHSQAHDGIARQVFMNQGPLALLPMADDPNHGAISAVVWTLSPDTAKGLEKLSDRGLGALLSEHMRGDLGTITPFGPRGGYPLGYHQASSLIAERLALVGDAGHGIHPIAGQGLNLGLRDAAALAETVIEGMRCGLDPADTQVLERYDRWRRLDTWMMGAATDTLNRLFAVPGPLAGAVRRAGMRAVDRVAPLRSALAGEALGGSGEAPRLLTGMAI